MFRLRNFLVSAQQCCNQISRNTQPARSLYSENVLGIDGYKSSRERVNSYFVNNAEKFRTKMTEFIQPESKNMIFTEDLKNMIHIANEKPEDAELVTNMCKKFYVQNKEVRFGNYVFGPVVMRMFYYLNNLDAALKCFKDPEMQGFFDQINSYQILLDMLYEKGNFSEIIDVYEMIKSRLQAENKYPRHVLVLVFAACYKENSPQSLDYAKKLWKEHNDAGQMPMRKAATFVAGLALQQNEPHVALEILSSIRQMNYVTVRNLKVMALARLNRLEDAFTIVRSAIEINDQNIRSQTFSQEVIDEFRQTLELSPNQEIVSQFKRIDKFLNDNGHIVPETIDELLCTEITSTPQTAMRKERGMLAASYDQRFNNRKGPRDYVRLPRKNIRPGLSELQ